MVLFAALTGCATLASINTNPSAPPPETLSGDTAESYLDSLRYALEENLLPFWAEHAWDDKYGGVIVTIDREGDFTADKKKRLIMQARFLWTYSAAWRRGLKDPRYEELARKSYRYLVDKFHDQEHGGYFFELNRPGEPIDDTQHTYAAGFVVYGLSEYHLAFGDPEALEAADALFSVLESKAKEGKLGYHETFSRDWRKRSNVLHTRSIKNAKTLNTHMHLMEAYTALYRASGEERHQKALEQIYQLILDKCIDPKHGYAYEPYDAQFNPIDNEFYGPSTSYGHNVELAWLLLDAALALGTDTNPTEKVALRLINHALKFGYDHQRGTLATIGPVDSSVWDQIDHYGANRVSWWEQAELLVALLEAYDLTGDPQYAATFSKTYHWIYDNLIDHTYGGWYAYVDLPSATPITTDKGHDGWKGPYHNGRALMLAIELIEKHVSSSAN